MVKKLEEEFEQLIALFESGDLKGLDMQKAMSLTMGFFSKLRERLASASPEEQEKLVGKLNSMYARLLKATQKMAQSSGLNEEQLQSFAENRDNFTEEQWKALQDSKKMVSEYSKEIAESMNTPEFKQAAEKARKEKPEPKPIKGRDSKWIKP